MVVLLSALVCLVHGGPLASTRVPEAAVALHRLVASGGRVAWYQGSRHDLIAYDAVADDRSKNTELHLVRPDGSERRCLTCDVAAIRKGFVGQPAWHPDGERLVIQVENRNSDHRFYNHVSWGIDNDLWVVDRHGQGAQLLWNTPDKHAALHPHLSPDGRRIVFAERVPTGEKLRGALRRLGPGGENQWAGWRIHIADVELAGKQGRLSNHRTLQPNGPGFYETHGFTPTGRITYSFTPGGGAYVEDSYEAALDGPACATSRAARARGRSTRSTRRTDAGWPSSPAAWTPRCASRHPGPAISGPSCSSRMATAKPASSRT
jgi:Tol biopolymer transport system component